MFSQFEKKLSFLVAFIQMTRIFGLAIILPVMSYLAFEVYPDASITKISIAIASYTFLQFLFQIPFSILSDKIGRLVILYLALALFALGSFICFFSTSIDYLILGRALQGSGAVNGVLTALIGDQVSEENRFKSMAIMGISIGASFMLSFILATPITNMIGLKGVFLISGIFALIDLLLIYLFTNKRLKQFKKISKHMHIGSLFHLIKAKNLNLVFMGVFTLHLILTALFIALPLFITKSLKIDFSDQWAIYLTAVVISLFPMPFAVFASENKQKGKFIFMLCVLILIINFILFSVFKNSSIVSIYLFLTIFFVCFNIIESLLPSALIKFSEKEYKGSSSGFFSTYQFLGSAIGALLGGFIYSQFSFDFLLLFFALVLVVYIAFLIIFNIDEFTNFYITKIKITDSVTEEELLKIKIANAGILRIENYKNKALKIKIDKSIISSAKCKELFG